MRDTINNLIVTTFYFIIESLFFGFILWVTYLSIDGKIFHHIDLNYLNFVMILLSFRLIRYDFFKIIALSSTKKIENNQSNENQEGK